MSSQGTLAEEADVFARTAARRFFSSVVPHSVRLTRLNHPHLRIQKRDPIVGGASAAGER